jgi:hypothetical protein
MSSSSGLTELANLVAIINENFNIIKEKVPQFPSINEPGFNPASEAFRKTQPEAGSFPLAISGFHR